MTFDLTLYGITDSRWTKGTSLAKQVEHAILGGATIIQFREKELEDDEKEELAIEVQEVCRKYDIPFLINDDVQLAIDIDADGVHLGQSDMDPEEARRLLGSDKIIGVTAKTIPQAKTAEMAGADYLGSGAVFGTSTKLDARPMEHELLDQICDSVSIPVVAIGGIEKENILQLKGRRMAGFAVVSGIFAQENIKEATEELKKLAVEALH